MKRLALLCGVLLLVGAFAQAYRDITVGGKFIFRLRAGTATMSLEQRAQMVEERLIEILGQPVHPEQITLREVKKDHQYEIYVRGRLLVTVLPEDGRAENTTVSRVANRWLEQIRRNLPPVSANPPN